jgi:hydroxymethylbilane synthase
MITERNGYLPPAMARTFTLASRASQLAQLQTNIVLSNLQGLYPAGQDEESTPEFKTSFMSTAGDKNLTQALYLLGGKALWTKELEVALKDGEVDMLVHSLKDVPTSLPEGCIIGGILEREDPVDSLVVKKGEHWKNLEELPEGSVIGTSSVRRVAQLKRHCPHLRFLDIVSYCVLSIALMYLTKFGSEEICELYHLRDGRRSS